MSDTDEPTTGKELAVGRPDFDDVANSIPGLARIAAISWIHTVEWGTSVSLKAGRRALQAATNPQQAIQLAQDLARSSGVVADIAKAMSSGIPLPQAIVDVSRTIAPTLPSAEPSGGLSSRRPEAPQSVNGSANGTSGGNGGGNGSGRANGSPAYGSAPTAPLKVQGQRLLQRSRDVWNTDVAHPAYERILSELAPDEGRILLLLLRGGPQPSVDVRTGGPVGMLSSRLLAPGITMIGARAGARYVDQVPAYLNNLNRLGLIWFSREKLRDPLLYQVVEAQPEVLEAMHSVRFTKMVRRSIHLTPFGEDFCRTCLAADDDTTELPIHSNPADRHLLT